MSTRLCGWLLSASAAVAMVCLIPASSQGQDQGKGPAQGKAKGQFKGKGFGGRGPQAPTGPTPKARDGHPDLSGLWFRPYTPNMASGPARDNRGGDRTGPKELPFTAWGKQQWENYDPVNGDYTGACLPFGAMRSMNSPDPIQFIQNAPFLALLYEQNTWFKLIPIDGRPHNNDVPSWFGDSVGHWEGDTLVVNTNNFNGKTRLDTIGHPHSDQLELTERFTRTDLGHMSYEVTIHDPKTYTEDWGNKRTFTLRTDTHIMEYSCEENNKSLWEGRIKAPTYSN
jgi:hypothetical protein